MAQNYEYKTSLRNQSSPRPRFEKYYILLLLFYLAFLTSDLIILGVREKMLPTGAPPGRRDSGPPQTRNEAFDSILARNIFNFDGVIPPAMNKADEKIQNDNQTPVASQLPLQLIGTIVHVNPAKSVATVEFKNGNKIIPFLPNDDMEGIATLLRVDRKRIIFRNTNNNRLEFIEIKEDNAIVFERNKKSGTTAIEQKGNSFVLARTLVDKLLSNLPEHLQQARAVPYIPPGSSKIEGYMILDMQPGSVFEQIGLKRNDIIKGVNNEKVDSPGKALELYQQFKTNSTIGLEIERDGRSETLNYTIQ